MASHSTVSSAGIGSSQSGAVVSSIVKGGRVVGEVSALIGSPNGHGIDDGIPTTRSGVNPTVVNVTDPQLSVAAAPANELNQAVKFRAIGSEITFNDLIHGRSGKHGWRGILDFDGSFTGGGIAQLSVAVQVRVMISSCGHARNGGITVTHGDIHVTLSVAVLLPVLAGSVLSSHLMVVFAAQVITGSVVSSTVISWITGGIATFVRGGPGPLNGIGIGAQTGNDIVRFP